MKITYKKISSFILILFTWVIDPVAHKVSGTLQVTSVGGRLCQVCYKTGSRIQLYWFLNKIKDLFQPRFLSKLENILTVKQGGDLALTYGGCSRSTEPVVNSVLIKSDSLQPKQYPRYHSPSCTLYFTESFARVKNFARIEARE